MVAITPRPEYAPLFAYIVWAQQVLVWREVILSEAKNLRPHMLRQNPVKNLRPLCILDPFHESPDPSPRSR